MKRIFSGLMLTLLLMGMLACMNDLDFPVLGFAQNISTGELDCQGRCVNCCCPCDNRTTYPIMRLDNETLQEWVELYNSAPRAYIDQEFTPTAGSFSLLDHLEYVPAERDQGSCGNCWVWTGTGILEIALDVQEKIKDRLSVQYFTSCWHGGTAYDWSCCGGTLGWFADWYQAEGFAIPWSNTNAHWQDKYRTCADGTSVPCHTISTSPNYPFSHCIEETIETHDVGEAQAKANVKNVLHQNKAVWFAFFLPNNADWNVFFNFWNNEPENAIWNPDYSCGHTWVSDEGAGHAVLCVGYDDTDPENSYWIMVNSWGTSGGGRPNGVFHVDMDMNYDCWLNDFGYSLYWQTLDVDYMPTIRVHNIDTGLDYFAIQEAIDAPQTLEGHTIFVEEGTYYENVVVNKALSLIGENKYETIIDGNYAGNVMNITANNVNVTNFTMQNSGYWSNCGVYIDKWSFGNDISHNVIVNNYRGILLASYSSDNILSENSITNNYVGIDLDSSSDNIIVNNNCNSNMVIGINLFGVNNTVRNNNVSFTLAGCGITVNFGCNNTIVGNDVNSNCEGGIILTTGSCYNIMTNNNINFNYPSPGIYLSEYSNYNTITQNNIMDNPYGIYLVYSNNNVFLHNNFVDNAQQIYNYENASANDWDDGYPSGGNYWSDYTGVDEKSGPNQDQPGSDGIGDTPYVIDADNQDHYALMKPYPWAPYDIGITSITTSKTVIGQGYTLYINITIMNYGRYTEIFNASVFYDETVIILPDGKNYTTTTLTSRNSTTITIPWNTTGVAKGNYTITAKADTLPCEVDTADNTLINGWVVVTIPGDINGDCRVNHKDLLILASAYGSEDGDPNYNPDADLNNDGKIDHKDLLILASNYGKGT